VAALEADHSLGVIGQPIDDLALALISPLRADYDDIPTHAVPASHAAPAVRRLVDRISSHSTAPPDPF
jgi:hypothetical protein